MLTFPSASSVSVGFEYNLNINLNLNGHTISTDIDNIEYDSMFRINVNLGSINLNISNGKLISHDTSYIFRFKNNKNSGQNINVKISNKKISQNEKKLFSDMFDETTNKKDVLLSAE